MVKNDNKGPTFDLHCWLTQWTTQLIHLLVSQGKEVGFHLFCIALFFVATFQLAVVVRLLTSLPTLVLSHLKRQYVHLNLCQVRSDAPNAIF